LQARINNWHRQHRQQPFDTVAYKQFLVDIGYLEPEGEDFEISTANVDAELASIAGPQLVVPISNARFSLNAANARWGSLYDAFYGTDLIAETDGAEKGASYNPVRGAHVVAKAGDGTATGLAHAEQFAGYRSEEHTSELQSRFDLVCRLLLEKKKQTDS